MGDEQNILKTNKFYDAGVAKRSNNHFKIAMVGQKAPDSGSGPLVGSRVQIPSPAF